MERKETMIWKNNDMVLMNRYYANSSNVALAAYLDRSVDAVEHKARRVRLSKNRNFNRNHNVVVSITGRRRRVNA